MSAKSGYFRPGQFLFNENDPSHSIFLIKKGTISIRKRKGAAFIEVGRIYSNEIIGELSFFDHSPRSAAAMALTEVEVLEIPFDSLKKTFESVPDYLMTIVAAMAERLRKANDIIRRLDRHVVSENGTTAPPAEGESAADILAATAGVLTGNPEPEAQAEKPADDGEKKKSE